MRMLVNSEKCLSIPKSKHTEGQLWSHCRWNEEYLLASQSSSRKFLQITQAVSWTRSSTDMCIVGIIRRTDQQFLFMRVLPESSVGEMHQRSQQVQIWPFQPVQELLLDLMDVILHFVYAGIDHFWMNNDWYSRLSVNFNSFFGIGHSDWGHSSIDCSKR